MAASGGLLPILRDSDASQAANGSCGPSCGCSTDTDDEQARRLDELRLELREIVARGQRAAGNGWAKTAKAGLPEEASFSLDQPLPLVSELAHRDVDGKHVWIGVLEGALVVLDDEDDRLFRRLQGGEPPARLRSTIAAARGVSEQQAWSPISHLLARLATAGMIRGIQGYRERRIPTPERFARVHLTQACQLECIHCYADSSPFVDRSGELPTERWHQLIADFAANGGEQILFTGGEALMHKGCLELLRASKDDGLYVTLFTNGILVPRYARQLHEIVDKVQVSLDGPDAPTNDEIRGKGMFERILRAIDLLAEQGTPTRIGMTVVPAKWEIWKRGFLGIAERYAPYPHIEFKLSYGIMQYGRGANIDSTETDSSENIDSILKRVNGEDGPKIIRTKGGCGYGEQLVIGPEGIVYPCHLLDAPVCHIDEHPVPEIISILKGLIRQVDVDHVEGCKTCEIRYLCGGNCRVLDSRKTGSRLLTTCTAEKKDLKYRNLVRTFGIH